jgi:hypothetical protein
MRWKLANPRSFVNSAEIYYDGRIYILNISTDYSRINDWGTTLKHAKTIFSKHFIRPKYFGKNIWIEMI